MAKAAKTWRIFPVVPEVRDVLEHELGISSVVAQVLINRGITDTRVAERFLYGGAEGLKDPNLLLGMDRAVERIRNAITTEQQITIYGDYDVDGITATALVFRTLKRLGAKVEYYIPERQSEGYGLNTAALESLSCAGSHLVITVDCGISATAEVNGMAGRLDFVITDHHQPPPELPKAYAIIDPKQPGCPYPDKNLAGVGVAFKLCQALWQSFYGKETEFYENLDLVAVGTIADIVPLTGENRILVKLGLAQLSCTANIGLKELLKVCRLDGVEIDSGKVGFIVGPRLNAAGRLSHAAAGVELLVTENQLRAAELAGELEGENLRRQAVEKELLALAQTELEAQDLSQQKVLVLAGEGWHPGVIGIVASRLVEQYYRPVVMISLRDGIGKGSCRSIPGFDIYQALGQCSEFLIQFGGHKQAAGLTLVADKIDGLRDRLNQVAGEWLTDKDYVPILNIDSQIGLEEVNKALMEQLACLAPYGMGNPSPVFAASGLSLSGIRPLGQDGRHFKLKVKQNKTFIDVMAWNMAGLATGLDGESIDLAFVPEINKWNGQHSVQLVARDLKTEEIIPPGAIIEDVRSTVDKISYIAGQAQASRQVLVLVNERQSALGMAYRMRANLRVACYEAAMPAARRELVTTLWRQGKINVLIAAEFPKQIITDHVILYHPPASWEPIHCYWREVHASQAAFHLYFLFGEVEVKYTIERLVAQFPDRTAVGRLYLVLKAIAGAGGKVAVTKHQLIKEVVKTYSFRLTEDGAEMAIGVLEELGLVTKKVDGNSYVIFMQPEPESKLNIEGSATFRHMSRVREDLIRYLSELSNKKSAENMWKMSR